MIKAQDALAGARCAASTAGMQSGADDYLVKPFSGQELISRVSARLEFAHARTESLRRQQAASGEAAAQRKKLHALFMQAPVALAILEGPEHTYTFANDAYRELLGGPGTGSEFVVRLPLADDVQADVPVSNGVRASQPLRRVPEPPHSSRRGLGRCR